MKKAIRFITVLVLGAVTGVTLTIGQSVVAGRVPDSGSDIPLEELRAFAEVFGRIKKDYVKPADDKTLLEDAIRGMVSGLDPHSSYLNDEEYQELQVGTTGEFGGLGIEVGMEDGFVKVISPIDDTPAQRAGIQAGDLVIRLDEQPVKGMTLSEAVKVMRGKPGTPIDLTIVREGASQPIKITVSCATSSRWPASRAACWILASDIFASPTSRRVPATICSRHWPRSRRTTKTWRSRAWCWICATIRVAC